MRTKTLGFIGGGRITRIFLQAFRNKNVALERIAVYDHKSETTANLQKQFPEIGVSGLEEAVSQDIVVIAIHPPVIQETLEKTRSFFSEEKTLLSLAPKISIAKISETLGKIVPIVRMIPNATSIINEGYNPVCFSSGMKESEKQSLLQIMGVLGKIFEVPESKLEAYAIVSAMAPTYFWFQWIKLCEIGEQLGLGKTEAEQTVAETMEASLKVLFRSGLDWEDVVDLIPVKPIGEYEKEITQIFEQKLIGLYDKISPVKSRS